MYLVDRSMYFTFQESLVTIITRERRIQSETGTGNKQTNILVHVLTQVLRYDHTQTPLSPFPDQSKARNYVEYFKKCVDVLRLRDHPKLMSAHISPEGEMGE